MVHGQRRGGEVRAQHLREAQVLLPGRADRRCIEQQARPVAQAETDVKPRERQALDQARDMAQLGGVAAHELAPRRHVEEEVPHLDGRTGQLRRGPDLARDPALTADLGPLRDAVRVRGHAQPRHGSDRGQRLAAKAERADGLQIIERGDLAGRVTGQRQRQFRGRDAAAVIAHAHQADAATLDVDFDAPGAGVQAVFDDFLDDRRRPLDHFAGSDLVNEFAGEYADSHAGA